MPEVTASHSFQSSRKEMTIHLVHSGIDTWQDELLFTVAMKETKGSVHLPSTEGLEFLHQLVVLETKQ
jgi:hypothetical protein